MTEVCEGWLSSGKFTDAVSFWRTSLYDMVLILRGIGKYNLHNLQMNNIYYGNLMSVIANCTPRKSRKVYRWTDFYKDVFESQSEGEIMSNEDISKKLHKMFGGVS